MGTRDYANELLDAAAHARSIPTFSSREAGFDMAHAYAVAAQVHRARVARGEQPIGRKIGFTNRGIWAEYGVDQPIWGYVYDTTVSYAASGSAEVWLARLAEPRIEPEIVLHFGSAPAAGADERAVLACVDWIAHGVEIVQSPFPAWRFRVEDTVAAGGLHGVLVVGAPTPVS